MNYKGSLIDGNCAAWNGYLSNHFTVPLPAVRYSALVVTFTRVNYLKKSNATTSLTCSDSRVITGIRTALLTGGVFSDYCAGNTWTAFTCGSNPVFCVNCKRTCVRTEACPGASWIINPCSSECTTYASGYGLIKQDIDVTLLHPRITNISISSVTVNAVNVSVNMSMAGNLYCGAIRSNVQLQSILAVKQVSKPLIVAFAGVVNVVVNSLVADSQYTLYCVTKSFDKQTMPLSETLQAALPFQTLCCRSILVRQNPGVTTQYIASTLRTETIFRFLLDSQPNDYTRLSLRVYGDVCAGSSSSSSVAGVSVLPTLAEFYRNSTSLVTSFVIRSTNPGCYVVIASSSGSTYYQPANMSITIRNVRVVPSTPSFTSVVLSAHGSRLFCYFDVDTDLGSGALSSTSNSFACSSILTFIGVSKSTCFWANATTLVSLLPSSSASVSPIVGGNVTLLANIIRAACQSGTTCSTYATVSRTTRYVESPSNPVSPKASLSGLQQVSSCNAVILDPTESTGFGNRPWTSSVLSLASSSLPAANTTSLASYLSGFTTTFTTFRIPADYFQAGETYVFNLQVTNMFGLSSVARTTVFITPTVQPVFQVKIKGVQSQYYPINSVYLFADVSFGLCGKAYSNATFSYVWKIYRGTRFITDGLSVSSDPRYFVTAPYSFAPSTEYVVAVEVTAQFIGSNAVRRIWGSDTLNFGAQGVNAAISGPSSRTISSLVVTKISASTSQDLDFPLAPLQFSWSCVGLSTTFGVSCDTKLTGRNTSVLTVPNLVLTEGIYSLTVVVTNPERVDGLGTTSTSITVTVFRQVIPAIIQLRSLQSRYNPGDKVVIDSTVDCSTSSSSVLAWTADRFSSLTGISSTVTRFAVNRGRFEFPLAFPTNALSAGVTYTFTLTAVAQNGATSAASFVIIINSPPFGGTIAVTPTTGTATSTEFAMSAAQWTDTEANDFPLRYAFVYVPFTEASSLTIRDIGPLSYVSSAVLGPGKASQRNIVQCYVQVYDSLLSASNASQGVTVTSYRSPVFAASLGTALLSQALVLSDATAIVQSAATAMQSVITSSVDCTVTTSCASLNRQPCDTVARTCGRCLSGYVGFDGPANLPCQLTATLGRVGASCATNTSCFSGVCSSQQRRCIDVDKVCPGGCSNRGNCVFTDISSGRTLPSCSVTSSSCTAQCNCTQSWFGNDCSLSGDTLGRVMTFRESVCSALSRASSLTSPVSLVQGGNVLLSQAAIIATTVEESILVSPLALSECSAVIKSSIQTFTSLISEDDSGATLAASSICASSGLITILRALSRLSTVATLYNNLKQVEELDGLLASLTAACEDQFPVNDAPVSLIVDSTRFKLSKVSSDVLNAFSSGVSGNTSSIQAFVSNTFTLPASDAEVFLGLQSASSISLVLNNAIAKATSTETAFQISVKQNKVDSATRIQGLTQTNASAIQLTARTSSGSGQSSSRRRLQDSTLDIYYNYTVVLQNTEEVNYQVQPAESALLRCNLRQATAYNVSATCLTGRKVSVRCPVYQTGTYNVTCPGLQTVPQCLQYDSLSQTYNASSFCSVASYSSFNTTCNCISVSNSTATPSRRRLQLSDVSSGAELATDLSARLIEQVIDLAGAVVDYDPYTVVFISDLPPAAVQELASPQTASLTLVALLVAGIFIFGIWDVVESKKVQKTKNERKPRIYANAAEVDDDSEMMGAWDKNEKNFDAGKQDYSHSTRNSKGAISVLPEESVLVTVSIRRIEDFFNNLCPPAFRPVHSFRLLLERLRDRHSIFLLIYHSFYRFSATAHSSAHVLTSIAFMSSLTTQYLRVLSLLATLVFSSVVVLRAVNNVYDSCEGIVTKDSCEDVHSSLITSMKLCTWDPASYSCDGRNVNIKEENYAALFLGSLFIALCTVAVDCVAFQLQRVIAELVFVLHSLREKENFLSSATAVSLEPVGMRLGDKVKPHNLSPLKKRHKIMRPGSTEGGKVVPSIVVPFDNEIVMHSRVSSPGDLDAISYRSQTQKGSAVISFDDAFEDDKQHNSPDVTLSQEVLPGHFDFDEFKAVQTLSGTMMRAARYEQLRAAADFALPMEECLRLTRQVRLLSRNRAIHRRDVATESVALNIKVHTVLPWWMCRGWHRIFYFRRSNGRGTVSKDALRTMQDIRRKTLLLQRHLDDPSQVSAVEKESEMFRIFLLELYTGHPEALVIKEHLFGMNHHAYRTFSGIHHLSGFHARMLLGVLMVLWVVFIVLLCLFTQLLGGQISQALQPFWLSLLGFAVVERFFVTEILVHVLATLFADVFVVQDVRHLLEYLMQHTRTILTRCRGVALVADTVARHGPTSVMIQHVNAACRVARTCPQLPIARLLLSLNDQDISAVISSNYSALLMLRDALRAVVSWTLCLTIYAPGGIGAMCGALVALFTTRALIVAIYFLVTYTDNFIVVVAVSGGLGVWLLAAIATYMLGHRDVVHVLKANSAKAASRQLLSKKYKVNVVKSREEAKDDVFKSLDDDLMSMMTSENTFLRGDRPGSSGLDACGSVLSAQSMMSRRSVMAHTSRQILSNVVTVNVPVALSSSHSIFQQNNGSTMSSFQEMSLPNHNSVASAEVQLTLLPSRHKHLTAFDGPSSVLVPASAHKHVVYRGNIVPYTPNHSYSSTQYPGDESGRGRGRGGAGGSSSVMRSRFNSASSTIMTGRRSPMSLQGADDDDRSLYTQYREDGGGGGIGGGFARSGLRPWLSIPVQPSSKVVDQFTSLDEVRGFDELDDEEEDDDEAKADARDVSDRNPAEQVQHRMNQSMVSQNSLDSASNTLFSGKT